MLFGDFAKAEEIINELQPVIDSGGSPPLTLITWYAMLARYCWFTNLHNDCLNAVKNGMDVAETNGIHLMDFRLLAEAAFSHLTSCNYPAASECLNKLAAVVNSSSYIDVALYNYLLYIQAIHHKDLDRAAGYARVAVELAKKSGYILAETMFQTGLALSLIQKNEHEEAAGHLTAAKTSAIAMNCSYIEFICMVCEARSAFDQGTDENGFELLRKGLAIGRGKGKFLNFCVFPPYFLVWMCEKALKAGIEVEYVRELIRKRNLVPSDRLVEIEEWPWPIRIYVFGKFEIIKENGPVIFSGKVQQKPLALLKVLIALGGREVHEEQLTDILWPDADGDLAHKSFDITLHRLRLLIGNDKAIRLKEGLLSLDPGQCWVDVWAFERLFDKAKSASPPNAAQAEKAVKIYRGHFLSHDSDKLGTGAKRERLRNKFIFVITRYCEHLESTGEWNKAVQILQKGLEIDSMAEQFYQHLMICHHKLGLESEVLRIYNQCSFVMNETLGIKPSSKTEKLRAEMLRPI